MPWGVILVSDKIQNLKNVQILISEINIFNTLSIFACHVVLTTPKLNKTRASSSLFVCVCELKKLQSARAYGYIRYSVKKLSCRREVARCFVSSKILLSHSVFQDHWEWYRSKVWIRFPIRIP